MNVRVDKLGVSVVRVVRPQRLVLHSVRVVGEAGRVLEELVAGQVGGLTEGGGGEGLRGAGGGVGLVPFSDYFLLSALVTSTEDYRELLYFLRAGLAGWRHCPPLLPEILTSREPSSSVQQCPAGKLRLTNYTFPPDLSWLAWPRLGVKLLSELTHSQSPEEGRGLGESHHVLRAKLLLVKKLK